jgi:hypothetical protein
MELTRRDLLVVSAPCEPGVHGTARSTHPRTGVDARLVAVPS